jgi:hypothetical protein
MTTPTTPIKTASEREREDFEAHIRSAWKVPESYLDWALTRTDRGAYIDSRAADQWSGWQARASIAAAQAEPMADECAHTELGSRAYRAAFDAGRRDAINAQAEQPAVGALTNAAEQLVAYAKDQGRVPWSKTMCGYFSEIFEAALTPEPAALPAEVTNEDSLLAAAYRDIAGRNYDNCYGSLFKAHVQEKLEEFRALATPIAAQPAAAEANRQQAEAWMAVFETLQEVDPEWINSRECAQDKAVKWIRQHAAPAQPAPEPAADFKCEPGCFYYGTSMDCEKCNPGAFPKPAADAGEVARDALMTEVRMALEEAEDYLDSWKDLGGGRAYRLVRAAIESIDRRAG